VHIFNDVMECRLIQVPIYSPGSREASKVKCLAQHTIMELQDLILPGWSFGVALIDILIQYVTFADVLEFVLEIWTDFLYKTGT
jgi:hypothetical protein